MFRGFADVCATDLQARHSLPELHFDVPLIDDFVKRGPCLEPKLYAITGQPQTYKTTLAVQLLSPFLKTHLSACQAIWLDADLRFPLELLRTRRLHLDKLTIASCRSSEDILFNLLDIDHQLVHTENMSGLRCIVIDGVNSSFWIDEAARPFVKRPMRWVLKDLIETFVRAHGINMVVVFQDLGNFDIWQSVDPGMTLKLRCGINGPQQGMLSCGGFQHQFEVNDDRTFVWRGRSLGPETGEQKSGD
jgi:hypothetical protein